MYTKKKNNKHLNLNPNFWKE